MYLEFNIHLWHVITYNKHSQHFQIYILLRLYTRLSHNYLITMSNVHNFNPLLPETWNTIFIHNKPYAMNVKIFRHDILDVINYSLMDCKETVKCIKFLLHTYT